MGTPPSSADDLAHLLGTLAVELEGRVTHTKLVDVARRLVILHESGLSRAG